jgi:KaiC domain protein
VSDDPENWFEEDFDPGTGADPSAGGNGSMTDPGPGTGEDPGTEREESPADGEDPGTEREESLADGEDPFAGEDGATSGSGPGPDQGPFAEGEDPFAEGEDPFGGGENPFGGGDFEGAFDSGMDRNGFEEEFDSDIPRIDLGIDGLDEMVQGGVPERSLLVTVGAAGTGKTTFGLQFLREGLRNGEKGVFITLEEDREAVLMAAEEKGWAFEEYVEEESLAVVDLDPIEMANSLASIRSDLPRLVREFDAERLVLDSVSLLEMMYDAQAERRTEVFDFTKSLQEAGVTTMLTSEASETNPYNSRHGIIEYLTDGVFVLQYVRTEFRETRLAVEIQKIRNANHSRETKPYEITGDGISVYQEASIF